MSTDSSVPRISKIKHTCVEELRGGFPRRNKDMCLVQTLQALGTKMGCFDRDSPDDCQLQSTVAKMASVEEARGSEKKPTDVCGRRGDQTTHSVGSLSTM